MALIPQEKLVEIRDHVDIINFFSQYLKLEKRGRNYWALCPFHQDSNPSLSISSEKKIFKCFVCGMSGNVFIFIQELQKISFLEAVKIVADFANIDLSEFKVENYSQYTEEQLLIFKLNELVKTYYMNNLMSVSGQEARQYLQLRNINNNLITKFNIGYASAKFDDLYQFLVQKNYSLSLIQKAGLCKITENNKICDYFYDRIIFPITNEDAYIIGFSGRILDNNKKHAKYLNSPETIVFKKEQIMYHLDDAKNEIRKVHEIILLEGYMDVISLSKIGINNTIAIMGTNLSNYHLQKISSLKAVVKIFLDGDQAGINATLKIAKKLLAAQIKVQIIQNTTEFDPDELVNNNQHQLLHTMIKDTIHPVLFALNYYEKNYNFKDPDQIKQYLLIIKDFLVISDYVVREMAINFLIEKLQLSKSILLEELSLANYKKNLENFSVEKEKRNDLLNEKNTDNNYKRYLLAEEMMLIQLILSRDTFSLFEKKMGKFNTLLYRQLYYYIIKYYENNFNDQKIDFSNFLLSIDDQKLKNSMEKIWSNNLSCRIYNNKGIEELFILMNDYNTEIEINNLKQKINNVSNEKKQELLVEIKQLIARKKFKKGI